MKAPIQEAADQAVRAEVPSAADPLLQEALQAMTEVRPTAIAAVRHHHRQGRQDIAQVAAEDTAEAAQAVAEAMAAEADLAEADLAEAEAEEDKKPLRLRYHEKDIHYNSADNDRSHQLCTECV